MWLYFWGFRVPVLYCWGFRVVWFGLVVVEFMASWRGGNVTVLGLSI